MANLTITIDDEVLRRARVRATQQDTSVNSILREYLEAYAAAGQTWETAADAILTLSKQSRSGRGEARWTRDELHER
jgi:plasmid stability protein